MSISDGTKRLAIDLYRKCKPEEGEIVFHLSGLGWNNNIGYIDYRKVCMCCKYFNNRASSFQDYDLSKICCKSKWCREEVNRINKEKDIQDEYLENKLKEEGYDSILQ